MKSKGGRPPLAAGGSNIVSVRLANATYDELYSCAQLNGLDISALIRDAIERRLLQDRREAPR